MTTDRNKLLFKHFLKYEHWQEAKRLLDFQISSPYKHYNQLNFFYFRKIKEQTEDVSTEQYFDDRIGNNAFYGLDKEFFIHQYTKPKEGMGLRKYVFLSYPMQLLFYSAGAYLVKLTSQFILDNKKKYNLSRYGGDLKINTTNGKLIVDENSMFYKTHYEDFKKDIKNETGIRENKVIIRLDIQNYFDCISMSNLLDLIDRNIKTSDKNKYTYDENTISLLKFFYEFTSENALMQSDSNIIADYLGFLYLFFGDLEIEDLLQELNEKHKNIVKDFKIIRYVDDIYLVLEFKDIRFPSEFYDGFRGTPFYNQPQQYSNFISSFLHQLSDIFNTKLKLSFNSKTEIFWIENQEDYNELLDKIDYASVILTEEIENEDSKEITPQEKINKLCLALYCLRLKSPIDIFIHKKDEKLKVIFRYTFDKNVNQLLDNQKDELEKIEKEFKGFGFNYVGFYPQEITVLIHKIPKVRDEYKKFLLNKKQLNGETQINTFDTNLILYYLCQSNFEDKDLIKLLANSEIKSIMQKFKNPSIYDVDFDKIPIALKNQVSLIEQIRLKSYAEKNENYSVALNHLLSEIQLICFVLESKTNINKYKEPQVILFLEKKNISTKLCNNISNLFDRRNNNPVSHSGNDNQFATLVSKNDYHKHKINVNLVIKKLLEKQ